ncbi:hypothetical protein SEVIR_6G183800v4 [Setaria viridis]|uniref:Protein XRI1 n=3 Tax=Setaria TaxID=4554 RepID=A0A368RMQ8_SETIT|nr:uncharacterized protein LOC101772757 [Setaria italica]XP_034599283.1 uncharacterized protein LOC117860151 [Setaria viridis]RCV31441.1 hypothetical protein SETIT_6G177400v2 [Setaria italica]TKW10700.1 hypothetical protein SEVIR_6G183800v2 [Setaria viridis]
METAQERELHGWQALWPLDTMACSLDNTTTTTSGFLFGWDPQLSYFGLGAWGVGAGDLDTHERELELVVPKCMESPVSEASTVAVTGLPTPQDAMAMPGELDELLQSLWDSDEEKNAVGFTSCSGLEEASAISSQYDDHFALNTILPTSPEKALTQPQAEPPSSSSSHCNMDPWASDTGVAPGQTTCGNSSSKRSAPEEKEKGGDVSCKKSRKAPSSTAGNGAGTVAHPFTVVKPGGADGSVTLADINQWILTPPARPVRHPVGEFACAPRVSAGNRPAPSGKTVAGFTRLRTAGRGTITIVRTKG